MKYLDEYRDAALVGELMEEITARAAALSGRITLMEVCGTHTMSIFRSGLKKLLPDAIRLISGPGCPVCVTPVSYLDRAIAYSRQADTIIVTFGDMTRVPGSRSSLAEEKSEGRDIRVVYSPLNALRIARENPSRRVIFLGIGFETTSPTIAAAIRVARKQKIANFFVLSGARLIPPAMKLLLQAKEVRIDGFLAPGHVSVIIGKRPYEFIASDYGVPCVIAGFEAVDIAQAVLMLIKDITGKGPARVRIQYTRAVKPAGNQKARKLLQEVFREEDSEWRGLGVVPRSGLEIREEFSSFDAAAVFPVEVEPAREESGCICGKILRGVKTPPDCALFGTRCRPDHPVGPCMVSSEGTCAAYYKFRGQYK